MLSVLKLEIPVYENMIIVKLEIPVIKNENRMRNENGNTDCNM